MLLYIRAVRWRLLSKASGKYPEAVSLSLSIGWGRRGNGTLNPGSAIALHYQLSMTESVDSVFHLIPLRI